MNDIVADLVARLDPSLKELWEERAAIMEFDGGLSRDHAECLALLDVLRRHPSALLPPYLEVKNNQQGANHE